MTLKNFGRSACCKLKQKQFSGPSETAHSVQTRERGGGRPLKTSSGYCSKLSECAASSLDSRKSALNHSRLIRFPPSRSVGFASPDSAQSKMAAYWLMVPSQTQRSAEQRSAAQPEEVRTEAAAQAHWPARRCLLLLGWLLRRKMYLSHKNPAK